MRSLTLESDPHRFTSKMRAGLSAIMNYVGGAIIYIRHLTASLRSVCSEGFPKHAKVEESIGASDESL